MILAQLAMVYEDAFALVNLPFTILLILVMLYWSSTFLGLLDTEAFDIDTDADFDFDAGFLQGVLGFLCIGDAPVMVVISIATVYSWFFSMVSNNLFNDGSATVALMFLIPNLLLTIFLVGFSLMPFRGIFKRINEGEKALKDAVGMFCIITSGKADSKFGQAEVQTDGAPLLVNVRTREGHECKKGEKAIIIRADSNKDKHVYWIERLGDDELI